MVHQVGSFEAKTRLAELLRLAERGEQVVVLHRGQRIAVIMGADRYDELSRAEASDWKASTREWLAEGEGISSTEFRAILAESRKGRP